MPETITTRCPSWARSKHRSLMTRVSGGFRSSGKRSPFIGVAILGYPTLQFKKADSFGFEPRHAAIREKRPKNRRRIRGLCQELWNLRERFASNTFDLVFARNYIDHSFNPEKAI